LEHDEATVVLELEVDGAKCRRSKGRKQHSAEGCFELASKLDAKYNAKVTTQVKGQKSNHSLIEGSDKGAVSSVIQSTNQSRVPSSGPGTALHPKGKDARLDPEHEMGTK